MATLLPFAAASVSVLAPLVSTLREVRAEAPAHTPGARQLLAPDRALAARAASLGHAAPPAPAASTAKKVDPAWWRSRLMWMAGLLRHAADQLAADPKSRAVVVRALGDVELAALAV